MHIFINLVNQAKKNLFLKKIVEDNFGSSLSYLTLIIKSIVLGSYLKEEFFKTKDEAVGLLLPNSCICIIVFFSIQFINKKVSILNFTSGLSNMIHALEISNVKNVITSRKFISSLNLSDTIKSFPKDVNIIYLEDLKTKLSFFRRISFIGKFILSKNKYKDFNPDKVAVVLYTSGTEGKPKGVELSHNNLNKNREQVISQLPLLDNEKFFVCLPFFHSFGLGIGVLLPVLSGFKVYLYPSPLHYKTVVELIYKTKCTVFFSTNTFLKNYSKHADAETFSHLNMLIAGAEKLEGSTYNFYKEEYNIEILEGYGVTEASPAVSVNIPGKIKKGSVGKILPEIDFKLEKIDGCLEGGKLLIKGDNIMTGYQISKECPSNGLDKDGWYDTGDVALVDQDNYLFIIGRVKRFAKIAGEMISLAQVETYPKILWEENNHAICSIGNSVKGEQLILVTDKLDANLSTLLDFMKEENVTNLHFPKLIKKVKNFPILGSGKIDYKKLQEIAESKE